MAEDFAELGLEGFNKITDKFYERGYDTVGRRRGRHGSDKNSGNRNREEEGSMSNDRRYSSQPPAHRGYEDDPYNDYDDEEPRGPRRHRETRDSDRYEQRGYQPYDQPRYPNDRAPGHNDLTPPSSSRGYGSQYATSGAAGGALAQIPKKRYDSDDRRRRSPSRRRSSSSSSRSRSRSSSRPRPRSQKEKDKAFRDSPTLAFDKTETGLGVGLAGALIGGYVGREMGDHKKRGTALGAVLGGIGANILEHRVKIYLEERKDKEREGGESREQRQRYSSHQDNYRRERSR